MLCLNCMKHFDESYGVCPYCGYIPGTPPKEAYHLWPGVVLRERYVVGTTVGFGGFGITYRAWDQVLEKKVAIKEYYPNGVVNRVAGEQRVIVYSGNRAQEFENGKLRFLSEARNMARFSTHPNIVNVYEFFEENNTACIVMEFLEGVSYKQYIAQKGGRVDQETAVKVTCSVLDALREIHKVKIIHRDVSPDNIFMVTQEQGAEPFRIKLIDFGAARFSEGKEETTLSIILKPGYAPPEQYRSRSRQGPWTDIYAVGAVLYRSVTGKMPEESVNRVVEDHLEPPIDLVPGLPQYLNDSILRAMALDQELRFQNVDQFQDAIKEKVKVRSVDMELKRRKIIRVGSVAAICGILLGAGVGCFQVYRHTRQAMYQVEARIQVRMPDVNGAREEQIREAGRLGGQVSEDEAVALASSDEMLGNMLEEYEERFSHVRVETELCQDWEEYSLSLLESAREGELPSAFESTGVEKADAQLWEELGSLDTAYDRMDTKSCYFLGDKEFERCFRKENKQIPISFRAPVLYVNTHMIPQAQIPADVTSLQQLQYEGKPSFCVGAEVREMYRSAFPDSGGREEFDQPSQEEWGYEPFLRRETAYYLGTTDDYEAVRASLGGIYKMVVLETLQKEGRVKGQFTHLWSISGALDESGKKAAESLVGYLLGERAQDVFNLQNGNGLSLNKNMMKTYVSFNDEFAQVERLLDTLEMDYGEEQ